MGDDDDDDDDRGIQYSRTYCLTPDCKSGTIVSCVPPVPYPSGSIWLCGQLGVLKSGVKKGSLLRSSRSEGRAAGVREVQSL